MTLKELAVTYREQDKLLQESIKKARVLLKIATGEELLATRRKLLILYDMSRDMREIAATLENYYGGDEDAV
ncbi:MAG: hypothetical protein IKY44_01575 [Clostridia bacterium]|nr:hypothetical protein [Clostridia bacterium]